MFCFHGICVRERKVGRGEYYWHFGPRQHMFLTKTYAAQCTGEKGLPFIDVIKGDCSK